MERKQLDSPLTAHILPAKVGLWGLMVYVPGKSAEAICTWLHLLFQPIWSSGWFLRETGRGWCVVTDL